MPDRIFALTLLGGSLALALVACPAPRMPSGPPPEYEPPPPPSWWAPDAGPTEADVAPEPATITAPDDAGGPLEAPDDAGATITAPDGAGATITAPDAPPPTS